MKALPKAILFDWDNTLVETMGIIHQVVNHTLQHFNRPVLSFEEVKENAHQSPHDSFMSLFGEDAPAANTIFYTYFEGLPITERFTVFPGVSALLQKLSACEIPLGIVSNKKAGLLRHEVQASGLEMHFQTIIGAGDAPQDKPAPDPLWLALSHMALAPSEEIWFVGDSRVDWACARACGCQPVAMHVSPGDDAMLYAVSFDHLEEIIGIPLHSRLSAVRI